MHLTQLVAVCRRLLAMPLHSPLSRLLAGAELLHRKGMDWEVPFLVSCLVCAGGSISLFRSISICLCVHPRIGPSSFSVALSMPHTQAHVRVFVCPICLSVLLSVYHAETKLCVCVCVCVSIHKLCVRASLVFLFVCVSMYDTLI